MIPQGKPRRKTQKTGGPLAGMQPQVEIHAQVDISAGQQIACQPAPSVPPPENLGRRGG
jgi:hypothetical protein